MLGILIAQVANGLVLGVIYVLIALGMSLVFGVMGIVNFAHGAFVALGAYFALALQQRFGWPAVLFAPVLVAAVGAIVERLLLRRVYGRDPLTGLILTFALALLIEATIRLVWGSAGQTFSPPAMLRGVFIWGPVLITKYRVLVLGLTLAALLLVWLLLTRTPFGRILHAGRQDPEMVSMLGLNLPLAMTGAFALACFLAALAGVLAGPIWAVRPTMGSDAVIPAFIIVTIGGLGSLPGAAVGGVLVGVATAVAVQFVPQASAAAMFLLMALVLLLRPRGLLGR